MNEELKQYLMEMESRLNARTDSLESRLNAMESRLVALIADEVGSLHTQIQQSEERIVARVEAVEARQRHDGELVPTLTELILSRPAGMSKTNNAIADLESVISNSTAS